MTAAKYYVAMFLCAVLLPCSAQTTQPRRQPPKITKVTVIDPDGAHITQLEVELQKAPDSMEPVAAPRQIRIDDRANVRFLIKDLSPLDVCTRNPSAPTPTAETPVAESIVTTVAGLGGLAVGSTTSTLSKTAQLSMTMADVARMTIPAAPPRAPRAANEDPEYRTLMMRAKEFFCRAQALVGVTQYPEQCNDIQPEPGPTQLSLANGIDSAGRKLAGYAARDFRGVAERDFFIERDPNTTPSRPNPFLDSVRQAFITPISSIEAAGRLQAILDEITTWATDLHKKYDYKAPSGDGGGASAAPAGPPVVPGALTVAPTTLSFSPGTLTQTVEISSGGQASTFTAAPTSDGGWLKLSKAGPTAPGNGTFSDTAPARGTFELIVTVDTGLTGTHYGSIAIAGTGAATGTTNVNVKFAPPPEPSADDLRTLAEVDRAVDRAKAEMSLLSDNNKTLEAAQGILKTAYMAFVKVEDDFNRRKDQAVIQEVPVKLPDNTDSHVIVQAFNLGTDRKNTATGYFACVSDVDGKTATTTNIYYSLLYQDVPHWSASAGFLTSFLGKRILGIADENSPPSNPPVDNPVFAVTDHAQVQLVPMAFVNYRIFPYTSSHFGKGKESELVWTTHLSAGVGVNPNTGTNQPEFFFGLGIGLNRFVLHPGVHVGRTEGLGGGYLLGTPVPMTLMTAPIAWSYHMAFSVGFSVRVAPY